MKILVTGGAGFIGSNTVDLLVKRNHTVVVVDNFSTGRSENLEKFGGELHVCDITDRKPLKEIFMDSRPDLVLHLAAQSAISTAENNPQLDLRINGIGTLNVIELSKESGVKRIVFSSTSAVYDEAHPFFGSGLNEKCLVAPSNPYGVSKAAAEQYIRNGFPNHLILRYGNVYGPRQRGIGENQVIARAFAHFIKGDDFKVVGHGNQKRDFVYVGDIAQCNFEALFSNVTGTFNAATGKSYSVNQVLSYLENIYGVPGYQWTHTDQNDPRGNVEINVSKIQNELNWKAMINFQDGLYVTSEWWEKNK